MKPIIGLPNDISIDEIGMKFLANNFIFSEDGYLFFEQELKKGTVTMPISWLFENVEYNIHDRVKEPFAFNRDILEKYGMDFSIFIYLTICQTLLNLIGLSKSEWDYLEYKKIDTKFNFGVDRGQLYEINLSPKQKTSIKKLSKSKSVYEIIIDIDLDTATKKFNKIKGVPEHTNARGIQLLKRKEMNIRLFVTLGELIKFPEFIRNKKKDKQVTYTKIVHLIFDKNGLSSREYNQITDEIITILDNLTL